MKLTAKVKQIDERDYSVQTPPEPGKPQEPPKTVNVNWLRLRLLQPDSGLPPQLAEFTFEFPVPKAESDALKVGDELELTLE